MKKILSFLLIISSLSFAQLSSLDVNFDARSIAMGESFAANSNSVYALDENPATLIGLRGINVFYNQRLIDWFELIEDFLFYSAGAAVQSSIGNFAVIYKKFDMGEIEITTPENPDGIGTAEAYDHTFILSYSNYLIDNLNFGVNLKTFKSTVNPLFEYSGHYESNTPIVADFGLLYKINPNAGSDINDELNFGLSLQNYGTDYRKKYMGREVYVKVPRFLRAGFAYSVSIPADIENIFKFLLTGEYKNLLNPSEFEMDRRDYWGAGMETQFYNLISLRLGGIANPFKSIYGNKGALTILS